MTLPKLNTTMKELPCEGGVYLATSTSCPASGEVNVAAATDDWSTPRTTYQKLEGSSTVESFEPEDSTTIEKPARNPLLTPIMGRNRRYVAPHMRRRNPETTEAQNATPVDGLRNHNREHAVEVQQAKPQPPTQRGGHRGSGGQAQHQVQALKKQDGWTPAPDVPESEGYLKWEPDLTGEQPKPQNPARRGGHRGHGRTRNETQASWQKEVVAELPDVRPRGGHRGCGRGKDYAQPSLRQSNGPKAVEWANDLKGFTPEPEVLNQQTNPQNSTQRGGLRGHGQCHAQPSTRFERWPKASEMAACDRERFKITWDSASEKKSSTTDSGWTDRAGYDTGKKRSKTNGKGVELSGWDGNWAPAPIDWDSRPGFRESQSAERINGWMEKAEIEMKNIDQKVRLEKHPAPGETEHEIRHEEVAPRYWIPESIDGQTLSNFWHEVITSMDPPTADYGDLNGAKPWWLTYLSRDRECQMLEPYLHEREIGIDPDEETSIEKRAREVDEGSANASVRRKNFEKAKVEAKRQRAARKERKQARQDSGLSSMIPEGPKCDLNLYIRKAVERDLEDVMKVHNYYVELTTSVTETENLTLEAWKARYHNAQATHLPFLVAYERGRTLKGRRKFNEEDVDLPDTLVGFAYAKDYEIPDIPVPTIYKSTVELQVCTNNTFIRKGVARCLLDQMLGRLDLNHFPGRGFDFDPEEVQETVPLVTKDIRSIIVKFPFEKTDRFDWMAKWLTGEGFKFAESGILPAVGVKHGKSVNLGIFSRPCNAVLEEDDGQK